MKLVKFEELPRVEARAINIDDRFIEGHQAIWNPDTGHVFCLPTDEYKLVSHQEMIEMTEEKIASFSHLGKYEREIRMDGEGERMRAVFRFTENKVMIQKGDHINPTVEIFNSYDRSWKNQVMIGAFRLVCTNGLTIGETYGRFKKRHIKSLSLDEVDGILESGFDKLDKVAIEWKDWRKEKMEPKAVEDAVKQLALTTKEEALLLEEEEVSTQISVEDWLLFQELQMRKEMWGVMTKWVFYNILTQFITHQINTEKRRMQLQSKVTDIFYN